MPDKSRQTANLVSDSNLTVDVINDRVGIGSASPQEKLDVQGGNGFVRIGEVYAGYNGITLNNSTSDSNYNILSSSSDTALYINRPIGFPIRFRMGNGDQMTLNPSGNLGISSDSPTSRLDVRGDARISGVVTATTYNGSNVSVSGVVTATTYNGSNVSVSGVVTATAYYGNGAFLSNISTGTDITSSLFS